MQNCALIQYGGESNMLNIDLNLLVMLNALLTECNVTKAAQRSNLSVSAMSRALNRLRTSLNDPLLMKSGRTMVLTPYALSIRAQVSQLMDQLEYVFVVPNKLDLAVLSRQFTLRASAGFAENYGSALLTLIRQQAPNSTLFELSVKKLNTLNSLSKVILMQKLVSLLIILIQNSKAVSCLVMYSLGYVMLRIHSLSNL